MVFIFIIDSLIDINYILDIRFCEILIVLYIAFHTLDVIYWILMHIIC